MKRKFRLRGQASVTGTNNYFNFLRISNDNFIKNPPLPGWYFSALAFGTYRLHLENNNHYKALHHALTEGINVIDTSANYMDGLSEELIGNVLYKIVSEEDFDRENFIIISKGGYIQGSRLAELSSNNDVQKKYNNIMRYSDSLWYCLDENFITDTLQQSRERLGVDVIDVFLLQNPEYFILTKEKEDRTNFDKEMSSFLMYQEIKKGFIALEKAVKKRKIQLYGISSNTLTTPDTFAGSLDISKVWQMAHEAAEEVWGNKENHHFAFVQFPFNIIEAKPAYEPVIYHEGEMQTLFDFCARNNITMLGNRPLNAMFGKSLIRLTVHKYKKGTLTPQKQLEKSLEMFMEQENLLLHFLRNHKLHLLSLGSQNLEDYFRLTPLLKQYSGNLEDLDQYNQFLYGFLLGKLNAAKSVFIKSLSGEIYNEGVNLFEKFGKTFSFVAEDMKTNIIHNMNLKSRPIEEILNGYLPKELHKLPLSSKALLSAVSAHPSLIILSGMRQLSYVKEALNILGNLPRLEKVTFLKDLAKNAEQKFHLLS